MCVITVPTIDEIAAKLRGFRPHNYVYGPMRGGYKLDVTSMLKSSVAIPDSMRAGEFISRPKMADLLPQSKTGMSEFACHFDLIALFLQYEELPIEVRQRLHTGEFYAPRGLIQNDQGRLIPYITAENNKPSVGFASITRIIEDNHIFARVCASKTTKPSGPFQVVPRLN